MYFQSPHCTFNQNYKILTSIYIGIYIASQNISIELPGRPAIKYFIYKIADMDLHSAPSACSVELFIEEKQVIKRCIQ